MDTETFTNNGTLEIWLTRPDPYARWFLANARARFESHTTRMTLDAPVQLAEALHPDMVAILQHKLCHLEDSTALSYPEFEHNVPGLGLRGMRVLAHVAADGAASASVRFVHTMGDIAALFHSPYGGQVMPDHHLEELTIPVLHELLLPAIEVFDHILEHGLSDEQAKQLTARVKTMRARRDELADYISLLACYLESSRADTERLNLSAPSAGHDSARDKRKVAALPSSADGGSADAISTELTPQDSDADDDSSQCPPPTQRPPPTLRVSSDSHGKALEWSPKRGMIRGDGAGILYGHQRSVSIIS